MAKLLYFFWLLIAALLFFASLAFVLVNRQPLSLDLLLADLHWQTTAGVAIVLALAIGVAAGLVAGMGIGTLYRYARGLAAGRKTRRGMSDSVPIDSSDNLNSDVAEQGAAGNGR